MCRALAVVTALAGAAAAAPPRTVHLAYAGDACRGDEVFARVREAAGRDPFADDAALRVVVIGHDLSARVVITDGDAALGARDLAAASCAELADAVALVIAMNLDRAPPEVVDREDPTAEELPERQPRGFAIGAGIGVDASGAGAGTFALRSRRGQWSVEVGAEVMLPATHDMVEVSRAGATAAECVHFGGLAACVTGEVGWVTGSGQRLANAWSATTPLVAGGARLAYERPLSRWLSVRGRLDGRALATSTSFTVDAREVWATPIVEGWLGIDVLAHIP